MRGKGLGQDAQLTNLVTKEEEEDFSGSNFCRPARSHCLQRSKKKNIGSKSINKHMLQRQMCEAAPGWIPPQRVSERSGESVALTWGQGWRRGLVRLGCGSCCHTLRAVPKTAESSESSRCMSDQSAGSSERSKSR